MSNEKSKENSTLDPLFVIFEHHLYCFHDSEMDRKTFLGKVVGDYLAHLRRMSVSIPVTLERYVIDELAIQVNTMLLKKIYGFLTIGDFQKKAPEESRKRAQTNYRKLRTHLSRRTQIK